jgi:hypothetical protein
VSESFLVKVLGKVQNFYHSRFAGGNEILALHSSQRPAVASAAADVSLADFAGEADQAAPANCAVHR